MKEKQVNREVVGDNFYRDNDRHFNRLLGKGRKK